MPKCNRNQRSPSARTNRCLPWRRLDLKHRPFNRRASSRAETLFNTYALRTSTPMIRWCSEVASRYRLKISTSGNSGMSERDAGNRACEQSMRKERWQRRQDCLRHVYFARAHQHDCGVVFFPFCRVETQAATLDACSLGSETCFSTSAVCFVDAVFAISACETMPQQL